MCFFDLVKVFDTVSTCCGVVNENERNASDNGESVDELA